VDDHDGAEGQTHDKKGEGLKAIKIAHSIPPVLVDPKSVFVDHYSSKPRR
jgi:hypothetical protein